MSARRVAAADVAAATLHEARRRPALRRASTSPRPPRRRSPRRGRCPPATARTAGSAGRASRRRCRARTFRPRPAWRRRRRGCGRRRACGAVVVSRRVGRVAGRRASRAGRGARRLVAGRGAASRRRVAAACSPESTTARITPPTAAAATTAASTAFFTGSEATLARPWPHTLEEQLKRLPAKPGVYLFRDERGQVLYIGKAKSLRPRVRSYFQATPDSRSTIQRAAGAGRRRRGDRHRHRGRGAAPRAEPGQAPPAAVQRPAARRQVVPVHRGHGRGRLPARDVHARAAPARRRLLRAVREREEGARDARRAQPRLPVPALRGPEAGPPQRDPVPRLPHRALPGAVRRLHLEGGLPRDHRRRDRVPLGRDAADPARARAEDAGGGRRASASRRRRATATGCSRSATWPSGRRPTGARSAPST